MAIRTSIGTSTANSYVSVASANTYFNARENSEGWIDIVGSTNATAANIRKENLLIQATRELDRSFRFYESKYNAGNFGDATNYQALEFPRGSNVDDNNNLYIPLEVRYATYEQALWLMERQGKRTANDGEIAAQQFIGDESKNYLRLWIKRQVNSWGKYNWQGSYF